MKSGRQAAKQAFNRLEARVLRYDKRKIERGEERGEEGMVRSPQPPPPVEEDLREEYLSRLSKS